MRVFRQTQVCLVPANSHFLQASLSESEEEEAFARSRKVQVEGAVGRKKTRSLETCKKNTPCISLSVSRLPQRDRTNLPKRKDAQAKKVKTNERKRRLSVPCFANRGRETEEEKKRQREGEERRGNASYTQHAGVGKETRNWKGKGEENEQTVALLFGRWAADRGSEEHPKDATQEKFSHLLKARWRRTQQAFCGFLLSLLSHHERNKAVRKLNSAHTEKSSFHSRLSRDAVSSKMQRSLSLSLLKRAWIFFDKSRERDNASRGETERTAVKRAQHSTRLVEKRGKVGKNGENVKDSARSSSSRSCGACTQTHADGSYCQCCSRGAQDRQKETHAETEGDTRRDRRRHKQRQKETQAETEGDTSRDGRRHTQRQKETQAETEGDTSRDRRRHKQRRKETHAETDRGKRLRRVYRFEVRAKNSANRGMS